MAISPEKLAANQRNSHQSTGPRTPEGKARVRFNAVRHGLLAKEVIVPVGDEQANRALFDQLLNDLRQRHAPVGPVEELFVEKIAIGWWRLRRATRAEVGEIRVRATEAVHDETILDYSRCIENLQRIVDQADANTDFSAWVRSDGWAGMLGLDEEDVVATINKLGPDQRKPWLLHVLEETKQAHLERQRASRARNARLHEAVMVQRSLPQYPERILRYETTIERSMSKAMDELEKLQRARRSTANPESRGE
jgi:hypothetical protein